MHIEDLKESKKYVGHVTNFSLLYHGAMYILDLLKREAQIIHEREAKMTEEEKRIYYYRDGAKLTILCTNIEVLCCMSIESFINFYGVKNLGEELYKRNYERLNITRKLEILLTVCTYNVLSNDEELIKIVKKLFDRRNQLVHPKASELDKHGKCQMSYDPIDKAEKCIADMDRFYKLFAEYDESMRHYVESWLSERETFDVVLKQMSIFDYE